MHHFGNMAFNKTPIDGEGQLGGPRIRGWPYRPQKVGDPSAKADALKGLFNLAKNTFYFLLFTLYLDKGGELANWKNFIRGLILSTFIFGVALLFLTFTQSPEKGAFAPIAYIVSIFFFIMGIVAIIGFYIRRWWMHNEVLFENVKLSIRQAVLFSGFICGLLALSAMRLLTWWDAIILAISIMLIELYFRTKS